MTAYDIRKEARALLKNLIGKWELFILPIILTYVNVGIQFRSEFIANNTTFSFNPFPLLWQFIISLFTISASFAMLDIRRRLKDKTGFDDCLRSFSGQYIAKLFIIHLIRLLLLMPWIILMMILPILTFFAVGLSIEVDYALLLGLVATLVGVFLFINRVIAYSQVEFILYDKLQAGDEAVSLWGLFKESKQLMTGEKFNYFALQLSFLGWYLLVMISFGLANFYVIPYTTTAISVFYDQLVNGKFYNRE